MKAIHFLLVSCALIYNGCSKPVQPQPVKPSYPITAGEVIQRDVPIFIESIGNVYSLQYIQIRPQVSGIIQEAYVQQGQFVRKGDPLYQIDPRQYQANLEKAQATLTQDQATLKFNENRVERYKNIVKQEYLSRLDFDQYVSQVELSKGLIQRDLADIALAKLNLEWCTPLSPIDGKISQFNIDPGNLVVANDPNSLTDIRQITPAGIQFTLNQTDFIAMQKTRKEEALKFEVFLTQEPTQPRTGQIFFIDNHLSLTTGTVLLRGSIPNEDEFLWPGEFVRIRLLLRTEPQAVLVPEEAIVVGQDGPYVYIYQPETSTVDYRLITKGETIDKMVLIKKGVNPGEKVVLRGQINLHPGDKVFISDPDQSTPPKEPKDKS
jgi:multidrug efflux system membrane fusion protein